MSDTVDCLACGEPQPADAAFCPSCGASWVVQGRYRIVGELGRGGMSVVYEARDEETGERVAVKVVSVAVADDPDWKGYELFERSAAVLRRLEHPGVPRVFAFGREEHGALVLVRELFDGGTLEDRALRERRMLDADRLDSLFRDLLELLHALQSHDPPVIHRDIKPSNIMFRTDEDWEPVLVDFDTLAAPDGQGSGLTLVGTPAYSAPEQLLGETSEASDVYSLGATMLFAATHVEPDNLEREEGRFVLDERLENLREAWREVLQRMLEPALEDRISTAAEALSTLEDLESAEPDEPDPPPIAVEAPPPDESAEPSEPRIVRWIRRGLQTGVFVLVTLLLFRLLHLIAWPWAPELEPAGKIHGHLSHVRAIDISDDGAYVLAGDFGDTVALWKRETGERVWKHELSESINSVDIAPDLDRAAVFESSFAYDKGELHVYDLKTGEELWTAPQEDSWGPTVSFSRTGRYVFTDNYGQDVRVYDAATGNEQTSRRFEPHDGRAVSDFVIRGKLWISGGYDDTVRIYRLPDWEPEWTFHGPETSIRAVAASPDGEIVAAGEKNGDIWIWSLESRDLLHHISAHRDKINDLDLSPHGRYLVSVARDENVMLWDVESGALLDRISPHDGKVYAVDWHDSEPFLVTGGFDRVLRVWRVD